MPKIIAVNPEQPDQGTLKKATDVLREGGVCAIPTETIYGLAADYTNENAIKRIFTLKGRPEKKPILLLLGELEQLKLVVREIPPVAEKLMARFWPGPLTIVMQARAEVSPLLTAGTGKIGVRLSSHPVPTGIARLLGRPVTGTSANISGKPSCTSAEEVARIMPQVDLILDAGKAKEAIPSTVVDVTEEEIRIIREGKIKASQLLKALG
ncbi:L-threonylcarbamoyladenylate synthase [Thermodesulfatator atlanticus]